MLYIFNIESVVRRNNHLLKLKHALWVRMSSRQNMRLQESKETPIRNCEKNQPG